MSLTRWSVLLKAPLVGALAIALAFNVPAMTLMHAQHTGAGMASMPAATAPSHHGPAGGQHPVPDRQCCDLCVSSCVSHVVGTPGAVTAWSREVLSLAPVVPASSAPVRRPPAQLLPPSIGPPARA